MAESPVLPSWRYHVSGAARILETADQLKALAPGEWFESPAAAAEAAAEQGGREEGARHEGSDPDSPPSPLVPPSLTPSRPAIARTTRRASSGHSAPDQ